MSAFSRAVLSRHCRDTPDATRDILMVGGLTRPGSMTELSDNDDAYLAAIIENGTRAGMRFAPDLRVTACNIVYHSNFVRDAYPASMVAFCMIYYNPKGGERNAIDRRFYRQDAENFVEGAWLRALERSGARYAVNIHRQDMELPTGHIARAPYALVGSYALGAGKSMDLVARPA